MTTSTDLALPARIASTFDQSVEDGFIHYFKATSTTLIHDPPNLEHRVYVCPDLAAKPQVPPKTPNLSDEPRRDPFQGPDFGRGEKVEELLVDAGAGREPAVYSVVHNLYALHEEHFMCIPLFPGGFRPQTSDLLPEDLVAGWRLVRAYADVGRETFCFFNGGPLAGASQAHLHMQFLPFQGCTPPGFEALARSLPPSPTPSSLPLPYAHFYISLPASLPTNPGPFLSETYHALLSLAHSRLAELPESALPPLGPKRESYNFFLTKNLMHLVPRTHRLVEVPREKSKGVRPDDSWGISVNGLAYADSWYVSCEEEAQDLEAYGLARVLVDSGYDAKLWSSPA